METGRHLCPSGPLSLFWSQKVEDIDLLRTCLMCRQGLRGREPRLLPCLHSFCKDCLSDLIQGYSYIWESKVTQEGIISCPVCKQTCFTTDVVENFFLKDFWKTNPTMARSCFECMEKKPAHSLCTSCNRWLCSPCTEEHRHAKDTGEHLLSVPHKGYSGTEGGPGECSLFCPLHNQEALQLFCETCDVLTCRSCLILEHKDHRFRHLNEALQNQRIILENVTSQVEEKKMGIQATAKQTEERLFEVKHLQRKVENQIKMAKMVLINELHKRTNSLLEQLERIATDRTQKLEQQLQSVMILNRQLEHVQNFINWAVCSKNSVPFLFSKELIVFQIQRLLETSCGSEVSGPWKIRFSWEPSFWTKQLSSLGCILTDGGQLPHPDASGYGNMQEPQSSFYPGHQQSPASQQEAMSQSHKFPCAVQSPTPLCCSQCHNTPQVNKSHLSHHGMNHHQNFRQTPGIQQQQQQRQQQYQSPHLPMQYNVQQGTKQQRCMQPHPLRMMQPCLAQQSQSETENSSLWTGKQHMPGQQLSQTTHPVCIVSPQDIQQIHSGHPQQVHAPSTLQTPSVQVQLGHLQKLNFNHAEKPQQHHHHHQQQQQQKQQQQQAAETDSAHEQVMQQSLDIIHQQFELEQMQKGLELLLQNQPASLQINQNKQPQHVQQTIVGQINYIVRQPAPVQQPNQEEVQQAYDNSGVLEDPQAEFPPAANFPAAASQPPASAEQRSASVSIVGFSNPPEMELASARLSRSVDPQMQDAPCQLGAQSFSLPYSADVQSEAMPAYGSAAIGAMDDLCPGTPDNLATGDALLGNATCKVEDEDFDPTGESHGCDSSINELALPIENVLEEPMNLSVRKGLCLTAPSVSAGPVRAAPCLLSGMTKNLKSEADSCNDVTDEITVDVKNNETLRAFTKEPKIPYVRLERLKICPPDSGQLPVFKVQPQNSEEDGTLLLLVEYGAQSSSMAIKANPDNCPSPPPPSLSPQLSTPQLSPQLSLQFHDPPELPQSQLLSPFMPLGPLCSPAGSTNEERPLEALPDPPNTGPADYNLHNGNSGMRKILFGEEANPIENEDFCAVCMNGGEMLCCDHCPKVFHLACHVPALLSFPTGEWVCTLCRDLMNPEVEYDCENTRYSCDITEEGAFSVLNVQDQRKCEKLVLSLYCSSLSPPFQEPVSPLARHYYQIIKRPMDLSTIRRKLQKKNRKHYSSPEELVLDTRLMFWNCAKFNYPDSEVAEAGRSLQVFFEDKLKEIYPDKTFPLPQQEESDSEEIGNEISQQLAKGFHWPSYGQECVQPKRRRRHTVNYKAKESDLC
ncbi:tripartite motif-containing protein 66 isoform X2 [Rhinatrema bivittatum]|uniref:tripartite motif-containing protein 66 isoform X2 n=1 Tax=Rhinatrema bivittatum TaxID=194408 RepID=UPI00112C29B1|nr:tripartite motif-containing protein 66 isoform X2 [Rhinatrema bivittatum]